VIVPGNRISWTVRLDHPLAITYAGTFVLVGTTGRGQLCPFYLGFGCSEAEENTVRRRIGHGIL
jgi:hypothetical protein